VNKTNFAFIGGFTSRSKAYAQILAEHKLKPANTLIFGKKNGALPGQISSPHVNSIKANHKLFIPDLSVPIQETIQSANWKHKISDAENINDDLIEEWIKQIQPKPEFIIYSGYGSQLVKPNILDIGIPFLHIHSGLLPDYRGSTTLYYSWLRNRYCGASGIFLQQEIDTGPLIMDQSYPLPPKGMDPDHTYDPVIRADLLLKIILYFNEKGKVPDPKVQSSKNECTYYVIHPLLKHIARLSAN